MVYIQAAFSPVSGSCLEVGYALAGVVSHGSASRVCRTSVHAGREPERAVRAVRDQSSDRLQMASPLSSSARSFPEALPPLKYDASSTVRAVLQDGWISWQ